MSAFRKFRILVLLIILFLVAAGTYLTQLRTTDWDRPLTVAIYPINGDGSAVSRDYINELSLDTFQNIETFFVDEAEHYGLLLKHPVELVMGPVLTEIPPEPPKDRNILGVMWWSLKIRFWSRGVGSDYGPPADIRIFVLYNDPDINSSLAHSLGLQKGLLGVVHAYSSWHQAGNNNMVIAHELLHTLGATDKYDLQTNQPIFPIGYAEPDKDPVLPQEFAEIMAGRVPLLKGNAEQPANLGSVLVGEYTAREIRWID
jgi:hypothetical protein